MEKSKFVQLLKSLNPKELKEFRSFLKGLHHRQRKTLLLFEYLLKYAPHFHHDKLDKSYLLQKNIFPGLNSSKRISNELHKLFDWLEQFLILKKMQDKSSERIKSTLLRDIYKERQVAGLYERKVAALNKTIETGLRDTWYHYHLLELKHNQYYYSPTEKIKRGGKEIKEALTNLEAFYQIKKLKYECELLSRKNILGPLHDQVQTQIASKPLHHLYVRLKKLIEERSPEVYTELKEAFLATSKIMVQEEQLILLSYLINHAGTLILAGERQGFVEAFELYRHGIDQAIIVENGMISEGKFHNITNIACELGEYSWAKKFVRKYQSYLLEDIRLSASSLAEARIAFGQKKYEQTLQLLLDVQDKNIAYVLQVKLLQVRSYYELGPSYLSSLSYFIQSFHIFLTRTKKVNEQMLMGYRNFLNLLKLLSQGSLSQLQLQAEVEQVNTIVCKSWIKQKIRNYQPSNP